MSTGETYITFGSVLTLLSGHKPDPARNPEGDRYSCSMLVGPPPSDARLPDMATSQLTGFQSDKGYLRNWLLLMRETDNSGHVIKDETTSRISCQLIRAPIKVFLRDNNTDVVALYLETIRNAVQDSRPVTMRLSERSDGDYDLTGIELVRER